MGWHTLKHVWHQGIATHAAAACRDYAFTRLDISRLVALIDRANPPSIRVAIKIGMRLEKEAVVDERPCLVYSVERDRQLANTWPSRLPESSGRKPDLGPAGS